MYLYRSIISALALDSLFLIHNPPPPHLLLDTAINPNNEKKKKATAYKNFNMEGKASLAVLKVAKMPLLWQIWM